MDDKTLQILHNLYNGLHGRKRLDENKCIGCHKEKLMWFDEGEKDKTRGYCSLLCQRVVHNLYLGHKRVREEKKERPDFRQLLILLDEPVIAQIIVYTYPYYKEKAKDLRAILDLRGESKQLKELIDQYILMEVKEFSEEVTEILTNESLLLFPSLQELYLTNENVDIHYIGSLTNLQNLAITEDVVGDDSLQELQKLTKLVVLDNSSITLRSISKLTKLNTLAFLLNDTLTDNDISLLPESLQILVLDECTNIHDSGIMSLSRLSQLTQLEVGTIAFQDLALKNMTFLKELTIEKNDNFLGYDSLGGMRLLTALVVLKCANFEGPSIPYKSQLKLFIAGQTQINDGTLSSQINLTTLDVSGTVVTDKSLKYLVNLSRLSARNSLHITGECFQTLTRLEFLDLSGCQLVTRKSLLGLTNLTELYLSDTQMRPSKNESPLKFPHLKLLWLRKTQAIQNREIVHFTQLEELSLAENDIIKGKAYLRNLTTLLKLDLSYNTVIENEDIQSFTRLESINLKGNTLIKSYALKNMPNLSEIVLRDGTVTSDLTWVDYV